MSNLVELSHRLEPGMPAYPDLPEPHIGSFLTHDDCARRELYEPGTTFHISLYELGGNTGTYLDAPFHRDPSGADLASVPLERLANLPGLLIVSAPEGPIGPACFAGLPLKGHAVLVRTDWCRRWGGDYFRSGPFLTAEASDFLARHGAALVGIDCANVDNIRDRARPAHTILLRAGIPVVEHLCGLDVLPRRGFRFFAVPPAIVGGATFPVRAFAVLDEPDPGGTAPAG